MDYLKQMYRDGFDLMPDEDKAGWDDLTVRRKVRAQLQVDAAADAAHRANLRPLCEDAFRRGMAAKARREERERLEREQAERSRIEQELRARRERLARGNVVEVDFQRSSSAAIPSSE